jgi:IS5 family transposase
MKAHIGVDAESGLVHTVIGTAANVNDVTQAVGLLHGKESDAWGDAGYQGVDKREELKDSKTCWHVAMKPGKRRALDPECRLHQVLEEIEKLKASVRAKVEHPFRVIKQQFGYAKVRYRGLAKNTARLTMLFALGNLWMVRRQLMELQG